MDILRPFRKCFCCRGKDELVQAVRHTAYDGTLYYYYHEDCLRKVLCSPEAHMQYVDLALDIANSIELKEARELRCIERAEKACQKLFDDSV